MVGPSPASIGGSGGAKGVGLQDRVFAWAAASMIVEWPVLGDLVAGSVVRVGAQTGHALDDVVVQTSLENYALFQVKAHLQLSAQEDSPLAKALDQAVDQYLGGGLRSSDGTERAVDPARDALVLCTDDTAPATVRTDLAAAVRRVASHPPGTPLDHELPSRERTALMVALAHVRRRWSQEIPPDDEALRAFLRTLRVVTLLTKDGQADHAAAVAAMSAGSMTASEALTAWPLVVEQGHRASEERRWFDRTALAQVLANRGVYLSPPSRYAADIQTLVDLSAVNAPAMESDAALPIAGGVFIPRSAAARALADEADENLLVVGDAGTGKSAVVQHVARIRSAASTVVLLRASDVAGANRVHLEHPLSTVLASWTGAPGLLVVDGVDALRGAEDREVLSALVGALAGTRWRVVATVRRFDARNNVRLQQVFRGRPLSDDPAETDAGLPGVRHLLVDDFSEQELELGLAASVALRGVVEAAQQELRVLLRNPFNLRLAAQLAPELPIDELLSIRSRLELLETYWMRRVVDSDRTARQSLLRRVCTTMISGRQLEVEEAEPAVGTADGPSVEALLSASVLAGATRFGAATPRALRFSHNILFDYAAAIYVLLDQTDPRGLLPRLDDDPSLPLVARPSIELLVDLIWSRVGRDGFWSVLLALAASRHDLTALAFTGRLVALIHDPDDLEPLAPAPGCRRLPHGLTPEQKIVRQLVGAMRTRSLVVVPERATPPLARLARHLAQNGDSPTDLGLSIDLLRALQARLGEVADEDDRTRAVAALLDGCRTDPVRREPLAEGAARLMITVIGQSHEVAGP